MTCRDGDDRVGTYLRNNREHLEAYLAVPAMGAVLHTANIRLFTDELVQTVNLAQDRCCWPTPTCCRPWLRRWAGCPRSARSSSAVSPRRTTTRSTASPSTATTSWCTANAVALSASDRGLIVVPMFHANA